MLVLSLKPKKAFLIAKKGGAGSRLRNSILFTFLKITKFKRASCFFFFSFYIFVGFK